MAREEAKPTERISNEIDAVTTIDDNKDFFESPNTRSDKTTKKPQYLNPDLIKELRNAVNSSPMFWKEEKYASFYNQVCAVMDRLETAVGYVNKHRYYPRSEEKFICFMAFACMIVDAPKVLFKRINLLISNEKASEELKKYKIEIPSKKDKTLFKDICMKEPLKMTECDCPTDTEFFEFIRSITFAHPYNTSRLFKKLGNQVSPWISIKKNNQIVGSKGFISIMMYYDLKDKNRNSSHIVSVSFNVLKKYIKTKYNELSAITQWIKKEIKAKNDIWKSEGIKKGTTSIETLRNIRSSLLKRYQETDIIDEYISYLTCDLTDSKNTDNVEKFRGALIDKVDSIYKYATELDYERLYAETEIIYTHPKVMHQFANYQLEKIFNNLNSKYCHDEIQWGLQQALEFSKGFAKKWVTIDIKKMSFEEIKLLVATACYLEYEEQQANICESDALQGSSTELSDTNIQAE